MEEKIWRPKMELEDIKNIVSTLDNFHSYAGVITIYYKDEAITNFTCGNDMQMQSDLIFNMILQSQFSKGYSFDQIIGAVKDIYLKKVEYPVDMLADFDYDKLFSKFNHIGNPMKIHELNVTENNLLDFNSQLKILKNNGQIKDYSLLVNYDNNVMFYRSSFDNVAEFANLILSFCRNFDLDTLEYLDAMLKKAKTLRAHLIMGTINPVSEENSLLFKLSNFGNYDFNRSLPEFKIEQAVANLSKDIQNANYDWHTLFAATRYTNYLSITYSDFQKTLKGLKSINNAINAKYPEQLDSSIAFYNEFFDSIKPYLNKFFYPSKKWGAFEDTINFSTGEDKNTKPLPIDKLIKNKAYIKEIKCIFAEASVPPARLVKVITDNKLPVAIYFEQFLGTLMSVYPEQIDLLSNWGAITREQFKDDID